MRKVERAIDPTAAGPARRGDRPVGMIIERNQNERLGDAAQPKRAQVMIIARAVKREWRQLWFEFAIKFLDHMFRRAEAKLRTPLASIDDR